MKKILLLLVFIVLVTACTNEQPKNETPIETPDPQVEEDTNSYNIFGSAEFDTTVTGYLKVLEEEAFGTKTTNAYFAITDFQDEGFRKSVAEGIDHGNSVNNQEGDLYLFNLGCLELWRRRILLR